MYESKGVSNRRDGHDKTYQHTCRFEKSASEISDGAFETGAVGYYFWNRIDLDGLRRWQR